MDNIGNYKKEKYKLFRRLIAESQCYLLNKHYIKGIFEIDVTSCRKAIKKYRAENNKNLSLISYLIKCIGTAIEENKSVQALRKNDTLVTFDDIDVSVTSEVEVNGEKFPRNYIIRKVNEKTLSGISEEIEELKKDNKDSAEKSISADPNYKKIKVLFLLPGFVRRLIWKRVINDPFTIKKMLGTVGFTSIAMFVRENGWAIPTRSFFSIHFIIGSVSKKPVIVNNKIESHEYLSVSVLFDHDVVDGGPASRLISRVSELVKKGDLNI